MLRLSDLRIVESKECLKDIPEGKILINTINSHSLNVTRGYKLFGEALANGDYLLPDGASIVMACRWLKGRSQPKERVAGWDLFAYEMDRLNDNKGKKRVMFLGSSERVLSLIRQRAAVEYPNLEVVTYSPPYKPAFTEEDNARMVQAINEAQPDLLWIGMTAPKQEVWTYTHWAELDIHCHVGTIGAVFDFYAGTATRAPQWMQEHALEWLYRLAKEPKRMWRRYLLGIPIFFWNIMKEISNKN